MIDSSLVTLCQVFTLNVKVTYFRTQTIYQVIPRLIEMVYT